MLEWVVISSPRGSSPPRNWTHLSCLLHWQEGPLLAKPLYMAILKFRWEYNVLCCVVLSHYAAKSLQSCPTLYNPIDGNPSGFSVHRDSLGKDTGVGCHALLLGIFPTQGLNPGPPYCRRILYHLSHKLSPRVLKWVVYPVSMGSSQTRNQTRASWFP